MLGGTNEPRNKKDRILFRRLPYIIKELIWLSLRNLRNPKSLKSLRSLVPLTDGPFQ